MKREHQATVLAWLTGEIKNGPERQWKNPHQIKLAIETGDADYITERAWSWLHNMAREGSKWRRQAEWCFEIVDPLVRDAATVIDPCPPTIPCPAPFEVEEGEAAA